MFKRKFKGKSTLTKVFANSNLTLNYRIQNIVHIPEQVIQCTTILMSNFLRVEETASCIHVNVSCICVHKLWFLLTDFNWCWDQLDIYPVGCIAMPEKAFTLRQRSGCGSLGDWQFERQVGWGKSVSPIQINTRSQGSLKSPEGQGYERYVYPISLV